MVGKVALTRTLSLLTGWNITGVWTAIYIAGPAYRVTVPAYILVATLRLKQKAEQTKRLAKQKAEREANKTKRTWYLAIIFLIDLAVLAVFSLKENTIQATTQKAVLKTLKTLATKIKEWQQPLQLAFERIDRLEHGVSGLNAFRIGFISPLSGD